MRTYSVISRESGHARMLRQQIMNADGVDPTPPEVNEHWASDLVLGELATHFSIAPGVQSSMTEHTPSSRLQIHDHSVDPVRFIQD